MYNDITHYWCFVGQNDYRANILIIHGHCTIPIQFPSIKRYGGVYNQVLRVTRRGLFPRQPVDKGGKSFELVPLAKLYSRLAINQVWRWDRAHTLCNVRDIAAVKAARFIRCLIQSLCVRDIYALSKWYNYSR